MAFLSMDWSWLIDHTINGVTAGMTAILVILIMKRYQDCQLKIKLASILQIEMRMNHKLCFEYIDPRFLSRPYIDEAYKGLMSTSNIQFFNKNLQEQLQTLYQSMRMGRYDYVEKHIEMISSDIDKMTRRHCFGDVIHFIRN